MKKFLTWVCMGVILFAGVFASFQMAQMPRSFDGQRVPVVESQANGGVGSGAIKEEDVKVNSAAEAIVRQNLQKTRAVNDVTSIVFDFRGYDTMGEAFILITAVAGTMVILFNKKEDKKEDEQK